VRRRILVITPFAPAREGMHGSVQAIRGLLSALADRHELIVLHLEDEHAMDPDLAARCRAAHALALAPPGRWSRRARDLSAILRQRSLWAGELGLRHISREVRALVDQHQPDVVQVEHGVLGEALSAASGSVSRVVTIYDLAASQVEFLPWRREGFALTHRLNAWTSVRQERRILSIADAAVVFTERDRRRLTPGSRPASAEVVTIPLGWELPPAALDPAGADPPTLLFVGSFIHPPNVDAALRLVRAILPRVRRARPEVKLEIVGGCPPAELLALRSDAVGVTGWVPSVGPHLDRAAVVVAPIAIGGGARVKVLEALAAGKAVVASRLAAEGIGARAEEELIVTDDDASAAEAIVRLLGDESARRQLASRARAWALRELSFTKMADRYEELYEHLARRRAGGEGKRR
jgi:glycosyltransferase involved in cell wall biosynthesis